MPYFTYATPMYFAAFLALCNALVLYYRVQETRVLRKKQLAIRWGHAWSMFASAFQHQALRNYSLVLLVLVFGWGNYFSFIPLYLLQMYHYSAMQNSLFFAVLGLGFSIGCGWLVKLCSKRYTIHNIILVSCTLTSLEILVTVLSKAQWVAWVAAFCIGITLSLAYSLLLTIFSNLVSKEEQGWVMGVTGSIMALCFGITSLCSSLLVYIGVRLPLLLAFAGTLGSALLLSRIPAAKEALRR
jgi:predicted MFS family arabinose efflux permease